MTAAEWTEMVRRLTPRSESVRTEVEPPIWYSDSEIEKKPKDRFRSRGKGFVWVCRRRDTAKVIVAALEATDGEWVISHRAARPYGQDWIGPRWVVRVWGVSNREIDALQRVAARFDPSVNNLRWDVTAQVYRKGA